MPSTPSILELQAFPILSASQTAQLLPFGSLKTTNEGEILFEPGDPTYCLVVVPEGKTAVIDRGNGDRVLRTADMMRSDYAQTGPRAKVLLGGRRSIRVIDSRKTGAAIPIDA